MPEESSTPSLRDVFNREVRKAAEDFPALKGRFLFVNADDGQTIAAIEPGKTGLQGTNDIGIIAAKMAEGVKESGTPIATKMADINLDVLVFTNLPYRMFAGIDQPGEMETVAAFDHELGHLLVPGAFSSNDKLYRETAADCFAALRHIQRYGDDSRAIQRAGWHRAFSFVLSGDAEHFTSFALDEIGRLRGTLDIAALTPAQTVAFAQLLAEEFTVHADVMAALEGKFAPARQLLQETHDIGRALKAIADIALAGDWHAYRLGSRALEPLLHGDVPTVDLSGADWDAVRASMKEKDAQFQRDGLLAGLPLKNPPGAKA